MTDEPAALSCRFTEALGCAAELHAKQFRKGTTTPYISEMLDFCGEHGVTSDVEVIQMHDINIAYERMLKSDVKYRFVIDLASLR